MPVVVGAVRRESISYFSTAKMRSHPASFLSIHRPTAPTTTGMHSYRDCSRDNSMDIVLMDPSTHRKGCASMRPKCCWTRMYGRGVIAPIGYSRDDAARNGYDNAVTS